MNFIYKLFIKDYNNVTDKNRGKFGILCGAFGIICNAILVVLKIVVGIISGSISLIGDALNNISDSLSSLINILSFKINNKPADKEHPYGHRKSEYIGGLLVSVLVLYVSIELFTSSIDRIINPIVTSISYSLLIVLIANILIKLFMMILYKNTAKKINSISLKATYKDSFNDIITTIIIVAGLYLGNIFNINVDGYLGLLLSFYVLYSGISLIKEAISKLMNDTLDINLINEIVNKVKENEHVLDAHDILTHKYGEGKAFMSLHVEMDASYSLSKAHDIVDKIERKIKKEYDIDFLIHIDPVDFKDNDLAYVKELINKIVTYVDENMSTHDIRLLKMEKRIYFDLVMPYAYHDKSNELLRLVKDELKRNLEYKISIEINYK